MEFQDFERDFDQEGEFDRETDEALAAALAGIRAPFTLKALRDAACPLASAHALARIPGRRRMHERVLLRRLLCFLPDSQIK